MNPVEKARLQRAINHSYEEVVGYVAALDDSLLEKKYKTALDHLDTLSDELLLLRDHLLAVIEPR